MNYPSAPPQKTNSKDKDKVLGVFQFFFWFWTLMTSRVSSTSLTPYWVPEPTPPGFQLLGSDPGASTSGPLKPLQVAVSKVVEVESIAAFDDILAKNEVPRRPICSS